MRTGAGIRRIDAREDRDRSRDEGRHRGGGDHADDRGVATVWAATAVAVLISVLAAMLDLAGAVAARHRAEAAADLAALAAAGRAVHGGDSACARAAEVAARGGGRVVLCRLRGWEALVEVEVGVRLSLLGTTTVRGRARAGPAAVGPPIRAPGNDLRSVAVSMITPNGRPAQVNGRIRKRSTTPMRTGVNNTPAARKPRVHRGRSTDRRRRLAWRPCPGPTGTGSTDPEPPGSATAMSLPSLRWGRRVPRRPPRTGSTAPRPPPAGPAPDGPAGGGLRGADPEPPPRGGPVVDGPPTRACTCDPSPLRSRIRPTTGPSPRFGPPGGPTSRPSPRRPRTRVPRSRPRR
jgi:secretion/DNA translocation related TadE-like protein